MLIDIIQQVREIIKFDPNNSDNRAQILRYINRAAQELYDSYDLPNSLWEREFTISTTNRMVTLPWYIGLVKAARRFAYAHKIQLVDQRPRHHYRPWHQPYLQWRIMGNTPLIRNMTQADRLRITLDVPEESALVVTIKGQTNTAYQSREEVTFAAGETSKLTTTQFKQASPYGIISITKPRKTIGNIHVFQYTDGREIAELANCVRESRNRLLQVHDGFQSLIFGDNDHVEILFKWVYVPLEQDEDQFLGTDIFDQAIIWKLREHYHSTRIGDQEPAIAIACSQKCLQLMQSLAFTAESEVEKIAMDTENPYEFAPLGRLRVGGAFAQANIDDTDQTSTGGGPSSGGGNDLVLAIQGIVPLRAITGYSDMQLLYLEFAYTKTPNDQQGGEFVFYSASTVADDGIDYVKPNDISGSNPGRWIRQGNLS